MANVVLAPVHTRLLKSWTVLGASGVAGTPSSSTTAVLFATVSLAAAAMGPNGWLRIEAIYKFTGSAGTRTPIIKFGATNISASGIASSNLSTRLALVVANRNNQASQIIMPPSTVAQGFGNQTATVQTTAEDTSAAINVGFHGQVANAADSINLEAYIVELLYGA